MIHEKDLATSRPEFFRNLAIALRGMEHNIDAYFFFRDLGRLTGDTRYTEAAERIRRGLLTTWEDEAGQFIRGIKGNQVLDTALPLDGASWASLFLFSIGERSKAERCLQTIEHYFGSRSEGMRGYRPYYAENVYETAAVNAYFYPEDPGKRWRDVDIVWGEGSLGVAAAYIKAVGG